MILIFHLNQGWNSTDIYEGEFAPEYYFNGQNLTTNNTPSGGTIYIHECFFYDILNQAITYSNNGKMLVELSTFFNCSSSSNGGAIYQSGGHFVLKKCCGVKYYSTTGWGHFSFNQLSQSSKNNILDSSFSLCFNAKENLTGWSALVLREGSIVIKILNLTKNKCEYNTAFLLTPSQSETSFVSFASIAGNIAATTICYFGDSAKSHQLISSNIMDNTCTE